MCEPFVHRGQVLDGRYVVEDLLGMGGTSEVWRATDRNLGRRVAIKVLQSDLQGERMSARIFQEAQATAGLRHPAIVEIYDMGQLKRGTPYVVMEFLVGKALKDVIEKHQRLTPTEAVSVVLPIADAIAAAHEQGIIHRDVKPENIFLARYSRERIQPKLVDFGVARAAHVVEQRLTVVGTLVGTPAYMAPEQTVGSEELTPAVDVWGLGVSLYEAVTGRLPFAGDNLRELFLGIHQSPLPYPRDVPGFDNELFSILAATTRKKAEERPSSSELVTQLARWALTQNVSEDLSGRAPSHYLSQSPQQS